MDSRQPLLECTLPSLPQFPYPAKKDHLFGTPKGCEGLLPRRHGVLPPQQEGLGKQLAPLQSGPSKAQPKGERPHLALESHWSCVAMVTEFLWDFFFFNSGSTENLSHRLLGAHGRGRGGGVAIFQFHRLW